MDNENYSIPPVLIAFLFMDYSTYWCIFLFSFIILYYRILLCVIGNFSLSIFAVFILYVTRCVSFSLFLFSVKCLEPQIFSVHCLIERFINTKNILTCHCRVCFIFYCFVSIIFTVNCFKQLIALLSKHLNFCISEKSIVSVHLEQFSSFRYLNFSYHNVYNLPVIYLCLQTIKFRYIFFHCDRLKYCCIFKRFFKSTVFCLLFGHLNFYSAISFFVLFPNQTFNFLQVTCNYNLANSF